MKTVSVLFLSGVFSAGSLVGTEGPIEVSTKVRREAVAVFKYAPVPAGTAPTAANDQSDQKVPSDVLTMDPFLVEDSVDRNLEAAIKGQMQSVKADQILKKLGTGVHEARFKSFSVGAATVLYIPVAVGISW